LYTVQAEGADLFGDYTLRFLPGEQILTPDVQATAVPTEVMPLQLPTIGAAIRDQRLEDHAPVTSALERPGDFQRFSFVADAGDTLTVSVRPLEGSALRPQFEVFGPDGTLLTSANSTTSGTGGTAFKAGIAVPESGAYIILITGEDNSNGPFLISVGKGNSAYDEFQGVVASSQQVTGTIQSSGERHIWRLNLFPGDTIIATASPTGTSFNPVLELATAEGLVLYRDEGSGANNAALIDIATITQSATYILRVEAEQGTGQGSYVLLWRYVRAAPTPTPLPAMTTILAFSDEVDLEAYQFYVFQGQAGQTIRVQVIAAPDSSLDPVVALIAPDGSMIAEADDNNGLNPEMIVSLPQDGTYNVRVNGYLSSGRFDVFVALLF
jgi:hypothetical protein